METGDWGRPDRIWGIERTYDAGRMIDIYLALSKRKIKSVIDVACGVGIIADGLKWAMPSVTVDQFDIVEYPEWEQLRVRPFLMDVMEYIKTDHPVDVVMFLNAYRNWDDKPRALFDDWLKRNAKYFITSGIEGEVIGKDVKNYNLVIKKV